MRRAILPRRPWCHEPARFGRTGAAIAHGAALRLGGWIAGSTKHVYAFRGLALRTIAPFVRAPWTMASPAAAIRDWRKFLARERAITKHATIGTPTRQRPLRSGTAGGSIDDPQTPTR